MKVNNFDNPSLIKLMTDSSKEGFYFSGFITRRPKDFKNNDIKDKNKKQDEIIYYIFNNHNELEVYKEDIIKICKSINARFYLYPRPISYRLTMFSLYKTLIGAAEINQESLVIRNINTMLKYERPFSIDHPNTYTLLDYDRNDNVEEFKSKLINIVGNRCISDMPTVYGHHFVLTNVSKEELDEVQRLEPDQMDIKPDSAILIYYGGSDE